MKSLRWFVLLTSLFLLLSGFKLGDFLGDTVTQQEYNKTYKKEYKKAREQGMSEEEARKHAKEAAEKKAAKKKQLFEGIGDVMTGAGEIDYDSELAIGESLALEGFKRYGLPVQDRELQKYANLIGNAVARNSLRPDIPYRFVVIESPLYNAFACPGGIIFVSSTLIKSMENESQLASVLAHEVSHVSHKHALNSIKRAKFLEGVGKITAASMKGEKGQQFQNMIGNLQTVLFDRGLDKSMEFEADTSGMEATYRTGYNPASMISVLKFLKKKEAQAQKKGSWFSTHPPLNDRIQKCQHQMKKYPDAKSMAKVKNRFAYYKKLIP